MLYAEAQEEPPRPGQATHCQKWRPHALSTGLGSIAVARLPSASLHWTLRRASSLNVVLTKAQPSPGYRYLVLLMA